MTTTMKPDSANKAEDYTLYSNVLLFFGIALAVLGIVAILASVFFTIGSVMLFGGLCVAAGIAEFISVFQARRRKGAVWHIISAIVYLVAGAYMIWNPIAGAVALTLVMSAFFFGMGLVRLAYGITHRKESRWGWFIFGGIINMTLGGLIALGWPATSFWVIGLFLGIELITYGVTSIVLSSAVRAIEKELTV